MSEAEATLDELERDELVEEIKDLRERISATESDLAFVKRTLAKLTDAELGGGEHHPLEGLPEAAEQTRTDTEDRLDSLEGHVTNSSGTGQAGTKKDHAETLARNEGVRVANQGIRGGAIDYPTIRDIAERQYEMTLHSGTVYAAFDELAAKWECFSVHDGGDGPNTKNKHLRVERDEIPPALANLAEDTAERDSVRREGN